MRPNRRWSLATVAGLVGLSLVVFGCAPAAAPSPTAAPAKPAPTAAAAKPAEAKPAPTTAPVAKPAEAKPATSPAAKPAEAKPAASPAAKPAAKADDTAQLYEAAKKEGKFVFYTAFLEQHAKAFTDEFTKKYPGVVAEIHRAGSEDLVQKTLAEARAKRQIADVTSHSQLPTLKRENLLARFEFPEREAYPAGGKDRDGTWTLVDVLPFVLVYNTNLVKKEEVPTTWEGLLDPKWKGQKYGLEQNAWDWFHTLVTEMGEQKGMDFMRKLAAQQPAIVDGNTTITQLQQAGEFPLSNNFLTLVLNAKNQGAPLDWVALEPVPTVMQEIGVFQNAPHPNAGKLFVRWILSEEGQSFLASRGRIVAHPKAKGGLNDLMPNKKIVLIDPELSLQQAQLAQRFREVFLK